jgi:glycerophosphoryl diester phosphodiesterase
MWEEEMMSEKPSIHPTLDGNPPVIIAHRGASGEMPEHTLAAYALAVEMGADYIEPDLVITKDGHLAARHDNYLSSTTDVGDRPEFAEKRRWNQSFANDDWFVEDFTLAELKTLRARQAFPGRSKAHDGQFEIPTFDEIMSLARARSDQLGRRIGVYPETKNPSYFKSLGLEFEASLLNILDRHGYGEKGSPVFIQSFEKEILKRFRGETELPLIMLLYPRREDDPEAGPLEPQVSLEEVARFADGVGPAKSLLLTEDGSDSGFVVAAHALGLVVHPWNFRADQLPDGTSSAEEEFFIYFRLGVDGVFTDFPDHGLEAREAFADQ